MEENIKEGYDCFNGGDLEVQSWFLNQIEVWPTRVDERRTTNLSFLYGGYLACREVYGNSFVLSDSFRNNIKFLERLDVSVD